MQNRFDTNEAGNKSSVRNDEEKRTAKQAELVGEQYLDSRGVISKIPLLENLMDISDMHSMQVAPLSQADQQIIFAIIPTTSQRALPQLRQRFSEYVLKSVMISASGFNELMLRYDPPEEVQYRDVRLTPTNQDRSDIIEEVSSTLQESQASDMFGYLVDQADKLSASDIHVERTKSGSQVRMRIDGVMHTIAHLGADKSRQLMGVIARNANFAIASPDPQTGHISYKSPDGRAFNMRVETIFATHGQDAVLRLLANDSNLHKVADLGFNDASVTMIREVLQNPHGLMMVTGPTGSGKTTTLYSILREIDAKQNKIITLEDPVESELNDIVQVPVDTKNGQTFAEMLRSTLRLDPDVILIGEIRDADTARTALQAALTGHLVLSSFHANSAAAALTRLREMVGDNPLFASAFKLIVAQRLVRTLPDQGRQPAPADYAPRQAVEAYIGRKLTDQEQLYVPMPSEDLPFGFNGRQAVLEVLRINKRIAEMLSGTQAPSTQDLHAAAVESGMESLKTSAVRLALSGRTSIDEIMRAIDW